MSQENVEVVRRAWEAFDRHDNKSALRLYDPEVEIHVGLTGGEVYRGLVGVEDFFRDWLATWDDYGSQVEEWIDAGDDVIAVIRVWGRGRQSGAVVEERQAHVWTLRHGRLWKLRRYETRAEAVKAVAPEE
jgi:ketosteroid isomerase-like protein